MITEIALCVAFGAVYLIGVANGKEYQRNSAAEDLELQRWRDGLMAEAREP